MRVLSLLAGALLLTAACGSTEVSPSAATPTSPTPTSTTLAPSQTPAAISGAWTGTSDFLQSDMRVFGDMTMMLSQTDRFVTGTWQIGGRDWRGGDWRGEISGNLTRVGAATEFNGRATFNVEHPTGTGRCFGDVDLRGTVSERTMRLDSPVGVNFMLNECPDTYRSFAWIFSR